MTTSAPHNVTPPACSASASPSSTSRLRPPWLRRETRRWRCCSPSTASSTAPATSEPHAPSRVWTQHMHKRNAALVRHLHIQYQYTGLRTTAKAPRWHVLLLGHAGGMWAGFEGMGTSCRSWCWATGSHLPLCHPSVITCWGCCQSSCKRTNNLIVWPSIALVRASKAQSNSSPERPDAYGR